MGLLVFFFGFMVSCPAVILLLKASKGKFFVIENPYLAGVLHGFWLWALITLGMYLELRFDIVGVAKTEHGLGLVSLVTSSVRGFLVGGLAAALLWKKVLRR